MPGQTMQGLEVEHISRSFGSTRAVQDVSFQVAPGEIVAVLGPSGCGKSTVLSIVAGLLAPDSGEVVWDGQSLKNVPPYRRGFGLMFQDFVLFPHRNVFENVAFGLQIHGQPSHEVYQRVSEALELVGLPGFDKRDVNTLSGGEQQRVALARSLAPRPRLLMLDEPLGSLDRALRERLVEDLRLILRRLKQTALYVTHDQEEAFVLADRVVLMNAGRVEQIGSPAELYNHPATEFVARFLGLDNLLPGRYGCDPSGCWVETDLGRWAILQGPPVVHGTPAPQGTPGESRNVTVLLRPDAVQLDSQGDCSLAGTVSEVVFKGRSTRLELEVNGTHLSFDFPSRSGLPRPGEPVCLSFNPEEALQLFQGSQRDGNAGI
ncbi:MAG TPA: ABC transporter ATP-binding protein [Anaerolineales bacterium]|nr:ABC transporter ATP-binding protein [Anaerolineales bacterium]